MLLRWIAPLGLSLVIAAAPVLAHAQVRTIDPNEAIDGDLSGPPPAYTPPPPVESYAPVEPYTPPPATPAQQSPAIPAAPPSPLAAENTTAAARTYERDDLLAAAEGVFGKGAQGLAGILENILAEQGEPNAYIAGREASGAFIVGVRYGSGVMTHRVEGQRPVYWTGPSVGFDVGGDANKVFVLVYNLYDSQELYRRFPAAEGRVYFVGGFAATYMRRGDVVLIPVRLGLGWRLGANLGYMRFSETSKLLPF